MALCATALLVLSAQSPKISLNYFQDHFIVREGAFNEAAPLKLAPKTPKLSTIFRRNSTFAVWDERGLSVRVGNQLRSTKLPDIALSPKAFSRDEILTNQDLIRRGIRSREVSALSGAMRVGTVVYFLARWDDRDGKPWSEAIIRVDLAEPLPIPKFLLRPSALSLGDQVVDERVFVLDGKLTYVARSGRRWGLATFDPSGEQFKFEDMGDSLVRYLPLANPAARKMLGYFVEATLYGTVIAGRIDLRTRYRRILAEGRSPMRFLDGEDPPLIVISAKSEAFLLNGATGAQFSLPIPSSARRTSKGLVVWSPVAEPSQAWLYDLPRWQVLASWGGVPSP